MQKTREAMKPNEIAILAALQAVITYVCVVIICKFIFAPDPQCFIEQLLRDESYVDLFILGLFFLCFAFTIYFLVMQIVHPIAEHICQQQIRKTAGVCYVDSYAITPHIVLTNHTSLIDTAQALANVCLYTAYSRSELEAALKMMQRKNAVYYDFPELRLPAPLGNVSLRISRRTVRQLLEQIADEQYVVFSTQFCCDVFDVSLWSERAAYVSRRDLRHMLQHPQWAAQGNLPVCNAIGSSIRVDAATINDWSARLPTEDYFIEISH